ncbi:MAG: RloB family protein [Betaproteobacteria bacterium]|nr:RloB family protein [Betaproteobacteria bacterium]
MGKDDRFRKRKEQKTVELKRLQGVRAAGPRILIVCEGQKTEPYYFEEFRRRYQLHSSRVRIAPGDKGSSPDCVVAYAEELFQEDTKLGPDHYDQVFCVIDRDKHATYHAALKRIDDLQEENKPFVAITSVPCFEYWLLLHFTNTRQSFHATGKKSICDSVIRELRKQVGFSGYGKGEKGIFDQLHDKTHTAIKYAQQAEMDAKKTGEDNPSTRVHHLILQLQKLASNSGRKT